MGISLSVVLVMCVIPFAIDIVSLPQFNYLYSEYSYSIVIIVENNYTGMNRGNYYPSCVSIFYCIYMLWINYFAKVLLTTLSNF